MFVCAVRRFVAFACGCWFRRMIVVCLYGFVAGYSCLGAWADYLVCCGVGG